MSTATKLPSTTESAAINAAAAQLKGTPIRSLLAATLGFFFGFAAVAHADLDAFLSNLNVQAQADLLGFKAKLSAQFVVPLPTVETIIAQVRLPGDAFLCLQLGQMARKPPERVVQTY